MDRVEKAWGGGPGCTEAVWKGLGEVRAPARKPWQGLFLFESIGLGSLN